MVMVMKSHRPERVANVVRSVVSDAIANKLSDPRVEPFTSVTRVEVSGDLEYAKVWVSVMGSAVEQERTLKGLQSGRGFVQQLLSKELAIRVCPRLSFHLDQSIKRGAQTLELIERVTAEREEREVDWNRTDNEANPSGGGDA
jgi:ribosome-binding factor A